MSYPYIKFKEGNIVFVTEDDDGKKEEIKQIQFCMWVSGADHWYVAKYDPRFKSKQLHVVKFARDEKMMREFTERAEVALRDLQEIYEAFEQ